MVYFAPVFGAAALFAGLVSAAPRPDSSSGDEVAVSAVNGVIFSDTAELSSQLSSESAAAAASSYYAATTTSAYAAAMTTSAMGYGASSSYDSSYGASSYDSGYGASSYDSGYVASSSSYDNSYGYTTSSAAYYSMATESAMATSVSMSYGSGSSNWGGSGYNDCVNQCIASFGAPPAMWTPTPSSSDSGSSGGNGVTHTVIVAPTQGVLRYVPFATNASVGDTIHFVWNANVHTVTKSSELQVCNKTSDAPFASGSHNKSFTFDQVVNDTNPIFYYCGTPGHCEKGMFGIINPPNLINANTTVGAMMPAMVANNSDLSAMWSYASNMTAGNLQASMWGQNIDLAKMPEWSHQSVMENVMYTQMLFASNPETLSASGAVDMSAGGNPIKFPMDITTALNAASAGNATTGNAGSSPSSSSASSSASSTPTASQNTTNGARGTFVSGGLLSVVVLAASFLIL